jgi:serine/threonine protein kinase/tetratricopeptide (TPR) repeat protein
MTPVTRDYFVRLERLFHQTLSLPPGSQRDEFMEASCSGDAALRKDLERLVEKDLAMQCVAAVPGKPLPRFGVYQAQELIGRGGMGAVYDATRDDGEVTLRVAVKVISSPLWSSLLEDRFRRERQILAQLRHPNIAAFLDGGVTEDGLPFLVMEYVDGEPIDRYCDARRLGIRERLKLFLQVCRAAGFAHQQLVVHRDIKPGNILVTSSGEAKLVDFGVARPIEEATARDDNPTLYFTPQYSSPEVLRGRPAAVADDVYSLGVLLYELLSGKRPFGTAGTSSSEIIQAVLDGDPAPASAIEGSDAKRAAENRGALVPALRRALRGDLDAIVAKAMEKSVALRYPSVDRLAGDIARHLDGHVIEASRASSLYRARKFVVRHKMGVAAAGLIVLSLAGGTAATAWEARIAARRFAEARELTHYLMFDLNQSVLQLPGATPVRAEMVEHSLKYLDRLSAENVRDPALRTEVGEGYAQLGSILGNPATSNIGQPAKARETYLRAIAILTPAAQAGNRRAKLVLANTKINLGRLLDFDSNSGRAWIQDGTLDFARMAELWPNDYEIRYNAGWAYFALMRSLSQASGGYLTGQNTNESLSALQTSIGHAEAAIRQVPRSTEAVRLVAIDYNMAGSIKELSDPAGATWYFRRAVSAMDGIAGPGADTPLVRSNRSSVLLGLGRNLGHLGHFDEGFRYLEEARQLRDREAADDPKNVQSLYLSALPYYQLADLSALAGNKREELHYRLEDIEIFDKLLVHDPGSRPYRLAQAEQQADAASVSWDLGMREEALRLADTGIPVLKAAALAPQAAAPELGLAASALLNCKVRGYSDVRLGLRLAQRALALNGDDIDTLQIAAKGYWMNGDRASAVRILERVLQLLSATPTPLRQNLEATLATYREGIR